MLSFRSQHRIPWPADGTLTVTSVRPNSADIVETVHEGGFAAYPGEVREARPSNGVFQYQACSFTFALDAVSFYLKPRDTLMWDRADHLFAWQSETFTVEKADRAEFLRFWDVTAFRLVAHEDLADTIAVYRPTVTATSEGLRSRTLAAVSGASAIAGRLQPDGWSQETDTDGRLLRRQTYKAYLSQAVLLEAGDVLRVGSTDYEVTSQGDIDQLMTFTVATCTRIQ